MNRDLILVRGVSGAGKDTFAELIGGPIFSADNYFMKNGNYEFDVTKLGQAHNQCQRKTQDAMETGLSKICVANTFTTQREMKEYFQLAKQFGYRVFTVIVENRHGGQNVHNVPEQVLTKQKGRFDIKL
jgi:predicted kinase